MYEYGVRSPECAFAVAHAIKRWHRVVLVDGAVELCLQSSLGSCKVHPSPLESLVTSMTWQIQALTSSVLPSGKRRTHPLLLSYTPFQSSLFRASRVVTGGFEKL